MAFIKAHGAGIRTYVPRGEWVSIRRLWLTGEFIDTRPHDFLGRRSSARDTRMFTRANEPSRVTTLPDPLNCNDCTEHSATSSRRGWTSDRVVYPSRPMHSFVPSTTRLDIRLWRGEYRDVALVSRGRSERKRGGSKEGEKGGGGAYVPRNTI